MEDIVAIRVVDSEGEEHYFLTWGRIFDAVDPAPLLEAVTPHLSNFGIKNFSEIKLCRSLREASTQKYFYECFFSRCQQKIPFGDGYEEWRQERKAKIEGGKEICYLGTG